MEEAKSTGDASPGAGIDLGSSPALGYAPILDSIGGDGLPDNQAKDEKADVSAGANDCMHAAEPSLTSAHALGETSDAESVDDELLTALGEDEAGGAGNEAEDAEVFGSVGSAFDRSARRHMARVAIAKTKPTTSFEQKRPLSHIFEDLAPRAPKRSVVRAFGVGGPGSAGLAGVQANSFGDGTCLWSGLRIKDRKVAEEKLKLYFHGRHVLRLSRVSKEVPVGDWLTIGVLATKCSPRSTAKGGRFLIWGLTNLAGDRIALFLFGSAYENFWKDQGQGIVVAVLNPKPFEGRERKGGMERDEPAFSVHEEGQIKILGTAKDYGICKSLRKDGNPCNNVINAAVCQYCDVHVAGEMRKLNSTRANMHNWSGGSAPVTVAHRAKMAQARQIVNRLGGGGTKTVQQMIRAPAVTPTAVARKSRDGKTEYVPLSESLKKTSLNKMTQRARNGKPSIASAHMKVLDERVREAKAQGVPLGKFKPTGPAPQTVPRAQSLSAAPTNGRTSTTIISTIPSQAMGSNPVRAAGSVSAGGAAHTPGHRRSEKPGGRGSALVGAAITAHSKSTEGGNGTGVRMAVSSSGRVTGRGTAPSEKAVDEETSLNRERQAREPSSEDEGAREIAEQEARLQLMKECLARKKAEKELRVDGDSSVGNKVERRVRPRDHDEEQTIIYADGTSCPRALPRTPLQEHSFLPTRATGTASTPAGQSGMETPPTAELRGRGKRAGMLELSDDDSDCDSDEEQMLVVQDTTLVRPGLAQEWEKSDRPIVAQERQLAPQTIKAAGVKIPVANPNRAEPAPHAVPEKSSVTSAEMQRRKRAREEREEAKARALREARAMLGGSGESVSFGGDDFEIEDDGGLEMGWIACQQAVKKARQVDNVVSEREFTLSKLFPDLAAKRFQNPDLMRQQIEEVYDRRHATLRAKSQLVAKMETIYDLPCKVWKCATCKYKGAKPPRCMEKRLGHPVLPPKRFVKATRSISSVPSRAQEIVRLCFVKVPRVWRSQPISVSKFGPRQVECTKGTKRFFECKMCKSRDTAVTAYPAFDCYRCGANAWRKTSMAQEKEAPAPSAAFSVRGEEMGKCHHMSLGWSGAGPPPSDPST